MHDTFFFQKETASVKSNLFETTARDNSYQNIRSAEEFLYIEKAQYDAKTIQKSKFENTAEQNFMIASRN